MLMRIGLTYLLMKRQMKITQKIVDLFEEIAGKTIALSDSTTESDSHQI